MTALNTANTAGADLDALQGQLLGDSKAALRGVIKAVSQYGFFNLFVDPVGMWPSRARQAIQKALGTIDLVVSSDFVKLLAGVSHDTAGFTDIGQF